MDLQGLLAETKAMVASREFKTDLDFQEHTQNIFQSLLDAHTRYQKPACYNAIFVQPFAFDFRTNAVPETIANEPKVYLMSNLYTTQYSQVITGVDVGSIIGKEVVLVNGVEVTSEISSWGDTHETRSNDPGARFNSALRSYLYRNAISTSILPMADLKITLADGSQVTLPWLATYTNGLANVQKCAAVVAGAEDASALSQTHIVPASHRYQTFEAPLPLVEKHLFAERSDREVIVDPSNRFYVSCFVQTVSGTAAATAGVSRVLVMKVSSFSPPGDYLDAWTGFLESAEKCLSVDFDLVVVDVIQNGGGYVCLGLRLIELLVKDYEDDHTRVQMNYDLPHSKLMDAYVAVVNAPDPYPNPQDVEQILNKATQQPFVDGKDYYYPGRNVTMGGQVSWRTNYFSLDCTEAEAMPANGFRPPKFMAPDKLIILTDGTCGSTCASFTKIPQEDEKATFVGVGGVWGDSMDVSSFAGGFVCNPDLLSDLATMSGLAFPKFATNQRWQFGWAAWYSAKLPTRPVQFTTQNPTYREPFWGFPHASISAAVTTEMVSALYDSVIGSTVTRLAAAVAPSCADSSSASASGDDDSKAAVTGLVVACVVVGAAFVGLLVVYLRSSSKKSGDVEGSLKQPLIRSDV